MIYGYWPVDNDFECFLLDLEESHIISIDELVIQLSDCHVVKETGGFEDD